MKKIYIYTSLSILVALLVLSVMGCGSSVPSTDQLDSGLQPDSGLWSDSLPSDEPLLPDIPPVDQAEIVDQYLPEPEPELTDSMSESVPDELVIEETADEREPSRPVSIETKLDKDTALAGEVVGVQCLVLDQYGLAMQFVTTLVVTPPVQGRVGTFEVMIERAGKYEVACQLQDGSLTDPTPEELTIIASHPVNIETQLNPALVMAGEASTVTCAVSDGYGNPILTAQTNFQVSPQDHITIQGYQVSGIKIGLYQVTCAVGSGASALIDPSPAILEIIPALPVRIKVTPDPNKPYYKPEETIMLRREVYDKYDNLIANAAVKVSVSPNHSGVVSIALPDSISFTRDGTYELKFAVVPPTEGGQPVEVKLTLKVDGMGPTISITFPVRAAMLTGGADITIRGNVTDLVSGVDALTVNGQKINFNSQGEFQAAMKSQWGLNLIQIEAFDKAGNLGSRSQSYLWSSSYRSMGATAISRAALARLNQKAIDDGDRSTLNDLASILEVVINAIDIDPLVPATLVSGSYKIPPFGPTVSYSVTKNGKVTMGRRRLTLKARNGGLAIWVRVENVRIPLKGHAAGFLNQSFTITASSVEITGDINISYSNGKVNVSVPRLEADVSNIKVNVFSGIFSFLNDLVTSATRGYIKSALEKAIRDALPDPIIKFLTGFKFDTSFVLPPQLGSKKIQINSSLDLINFDNQGGTLGLAVALSTTRGIPNAKLGTPLRGQNMPTWLSTYAFGVGLSYNILNHALTTSWYSGAFAQDLSSILSAGGTSLPLDPKNMKVKIDALLPPILHIGTQGHHVDLGVGDLFVDLDFDMQGTANVKAKAYVTAVFGANLSLTPKNEITLQLITTPKLIAIDLTEVTGLGSVNPAELSKLLQSLAPQISQFISSSVLQKFPIPTIDLSSFAGQYGIPPNTKLTIHNGQMLTTGDYLRITGDLR
jgi:hypothetical protein